MKPVTIIAEAGVNHNGSVLVAKQLIDAACEARADTVKFQTFQADRLAARRAECADYQIKNTGGAKNQYEMLKALELSGEAHQELSGYCAQKGIEFLSSPFDEESARFLAEEIGVKRFKIPSGEITNLPFLEYVAQFNRPVILSTGMSDLKEVEEAVQVLRRSLAPEAIVLLHCTTSYPCAYEDVHLNAMVTLKNTFGLAVGYSDHTPGVEVAAAAVALGACVIEKHFTLDRNMTGPDHKASLEPEALAEMVEAIRHIEQALGSGEKKPVDSELAIRTQVRKSLCASRPLSAGTVLTPDDIVAKRPGEGVSPAAAEHFVGKKLKHSKAPDEFLLWSDVEAV